MKGNAQGLDGQGTLEIVAEGRALSGGSSSSTEDMRAPPARHQASPPIIQATQHQKKKQNSRLVAQASRVKTPERKAEMIVDPYKYLIKLEFNPNSETIDLKQYSDSVQTYLRLLGRNTRIEKIRAEFMGRPGYDEPGGPGAKIAAAELAGGWYVLALASHPRDDSIPRGIFFDPSTITAKAVRKCPLMPWIYGIRADTLDDVQAYGVTLGDAIHPDHYVQPHHLSPYVSVGRSLILTNTIVPLPQPLMHSTDQRWESLVAECYTSSHPIDIVTNFFNININDNEGLILAARDYQLAASFFDGRPGLDQAWDDAFDIYGRDVLGYDDFED